jgi:hypothetical protein
VTALADVHGCPSCRCGFPRCSECGWTLPGHDEPLHLPIEQWCSRSPVVRAIKADEKRRGVYQAEDWR